MQEMYQDVYLPMTEFRKEVYQGIYLTPSGLDEIWWLYGDTLLNLCECNSLPLSVNRGISLARVHHFGQYQSLLPIWFKNYGSHLILTQV